MPSSFTIQLNHLRFTAAHGFFTEEVTVRNEFEVNLSLKIDAPDLMVSSLDQTINYAEVFRTVKEIFSVPTKLLEPLAMKIAGDLKQQFPALRHISVQIIKLNPPIESFIGSVSVGYEKEFAN